MAERIQDVHCRRQSFGVSWEQGGSLEVRGERRPPSQWLFSSVFRFLFRRSMVHRHEGRCTQAYDYDKDRRRPALRADWVFSLRWRYTPLAFYSGAPLGTHQVLVIHLGSYTSKNIIPNIGNSNQAGMCLHSPTLYDPERQPRRFRQKIDIFNPRARLGAGVMSLVPSIRPPPGNSRSAPLYQR